MRVKFGLKIANRLGKMSECQDFLNPHCRANTRGTLRLIDNTVVCIIIVDC